MLSPRQKLATGLTLVVAALTLGGSGGLQGRVQDAQDGLSQYLELPYCGDDMINPGEECEYPSTNDNAYCLQAEAKIVDGVEYSRDAFGICNSVCLCEADLFTVVGK